MFRVFACVNLYWVHVMIYSVLSISGGFLQDQEPLSGPQGWDKTRLVGSAYFRDWKPVFCFLFYPWALIQGPWKKGTHMLRLRAGESIRKVLIIDWDNSSVVKHLSAMCKTLSLIP